MSQDAIHTALDAFLGQFSAGGEINTVGSQYEPKAGVPYLASRVSAYDRRPLGLGADTPHQEYGFYQINVNRPATEGRARATQLADLLVKLFARGTPLALGTGQVLTIEWASAEPLIAAGDWLTVPVVVSWFCTG